MGFLWAASHSLRDIWHFVLSSIVHVGIIMAEYRGKGEAIYCFSGQLRPLKRAIICQVVMHGLRGTKWSRF